MLELIETIEAEIDSAASLGHSSDGSISEIEKLLLVLVQCTTAARTRAHAVDYRLAGKMNDAMCSELASDDYTAAARKIAGQS